MVEYIKQTLLLLANFLSTIYSGGENKLSRFSKLASSINYNDITFGPGKEKGDANATLKEAHCLYMSESYEEFVDVMNRRFDSFLIAQIDEVAKIKDAWAPFVLATMICISIESISRLIYSNKDPRKRFKKFLQKISDDFDIKINKHFNFARTIHHEFSGKFLRLYYDGNLTYSDLFYFEFRNSMIHGYVGKNVFLEHKADKCKKMELREDLGGLVLNPYWLWGEFKKPYGKFWGNLKNKIVSDSEDDQNSAESIIQEMYKIHVGIDDL